MTQRTATAEGFVAMLRSRRVLARKWLHVRADDGRPEIGDAIRAAGGEHRLVIGYRLTRPAVPETVVRSPHESFSAT